MKDAPLDEVRRLGPFVLHTLLGRGGGGEAWAGRHGPTGAEVVVKRAPLGEAVSEARLDREIAHVSRLDHPHVVRVLDARRRIAARPGEPPFLVVARAARGALSPRSFAGEPGALVAALLDALAGLGHVHARGLLHLDVKPSNLFVHESGGLVRVQIGDFGASIARWAWDAPDTSELVGTPGFSAPEHVAGDRASFGAWTDLWSLGATAKRLGEARSTAGQGLELPAPLLRWIARCLAPRPCERFATAAHAAHALREARREWVGGELGEGDRVALARVTEQAGQARDAGVGPGLPSGSSVASFAVRDERSWPSSIQPSRTAPFVGGPLAEPPCASAEPPSSNDRSRQGSFVAGRSPDTNEPSAPHGDDLPLGLGAGAVAVRHPPLVGRQALLAGLRSSWTEALAADRGIVRVLAGPAGAGTTRIAEHVAEDAHQRDGAIVLKVSLGSGRGGLADALQRWALGAGPMPRGRSAAVAHVRGRLAAEGLGRAAPAMAFERDVELEPEPALVDGLADLLDDRRRSSAQLSALLERLIDALRARGPLVLVVDGLEAARGPQTWLENALAQIVRGTLRREGARAGHGALVVITETRPTPVGAGVAALRLDAEAIAALRVELVPPLDRFEAERLASRLLGFSDRASQAVAARSEGLPAHLVQHVSTWVREGVLVSGPEGLALVGAAEPPAPPSLAHAARRRLEEALGPLSEPALRALALSSLLDDEGASAAAWAHEANDGSAPPSWASGLPPLPVDALVRAGLAIRTASGLRWTTRGFGDALLSQLGPGEARAAYAAVAAALEAAGTPAVAGEAALPPGPLGPKLEGGRGAVIARWLARADEPLAALDAMARVLSVDLDPDVARGLLETADRLVDRFDEPIERALVTALRGRMHFERGEQGAARRDATLARALLATAPLPPSQEAVSVRDARIATAQLHALHVLALLHATEGQAAEEALALAAEAARWAAPLGPDDLLAARSLSARLFIMTSRCTEALTHLAGWIEQGAGAAPATLWRAWILHADAFTNAGIPVHAIAPCERAIAAMRAAGGHWMLGQAQNTLADSLIRQRRFDEALSPLRAALAEFYPRTPTAGYVRANLAFCHLLLGELAEAERWVHEALARLAIDARHRLWCLVQTLRLPLLARGDRTALDATCDDIEGWLTTQRLIFAEPAEAATLAAEALPPEDTTRRVRLLSLARRLTEHVEDTTLRLRLEPRWRILD